MPKMQIGETEFELSVVDYKRDMDICESIEGFIDKDMAWLDIRLAVKNRYLDISMCDELLVISELESIIDNCDAILHNRPLKQEELYFTEPDISMRFYPHVCQAEISIELRDSRGVYVGEYWTITLVRDKIKELLDGLKAETAR